MNKLTDIYNTETFYLDGKFSLPSDKYDKVWCSKISWPGYNYIFDRKFLRGHEKNGFVEFNAPDDGIYQICAENDESVIDHFVEVNNKKPSLVNFRYVKMMAMDEFYDKAKDGGKMPPTFKR